MIHEQVQVSLFARIAAMMDKDKEHLWLSIFIGYSWKF
jgi:hypothetical protein